MKKLKDLERRGKESYAIDDNDRWVLVNNPEQGPCQEKEKLEEWLKAHHGETIQGEVKEKLERWAKLNKQTDRGD